MSESLHRAFGLTILSEIPLPELPVGSGSPDVSIRLAELPHGDRADGSNARQPFVSTQGGEVIGWSPLIGAFAIRDGTTILIHRDEAADDRATRLALVGPFLGLVLAQREAFVLHASTVSLAGGAVAFFGPSGRGKSTLTAFFAQRGHPLIADDITVIDTEVSPLLVQPGFPRVKLWPDSARALDHDLAILPVLRPDMTKRSLAVADRFAATPVRLIRCYMLEDGDEEIISEMTPSDATMALVRCTYQPHLVLEAGGAARNLGQCATVVRAGLVRRLTRRRQFESLEDVARLVEADVAIS